MAKAAIVIVHYKGENDTLECLRSVNNTHIKKKQFHIIVVINTPRDGIKGNDNIFYLDLKKDYP